MDTELLIYEIRNHPYLWDSSHNSYKDRKLKNLAWMRIANVATENFESRTQLEKRLIVQEAVSKWKSIRDNYVRSIKKQNEIKKSGCLKPLKRYIYEKQLGFLRKYQELPSAGDPQLEIEETSMNFDSDQNNESDKIKTTTVDSDNQNINLQPLINKSKTKSNDSTLNFESDITNQITDDKSKSLDPIIVNSRHVCKEPRKKKKKLQLEDKLSKFIDLNMKKTNRKIDEDDDDDMAFYKSTLPILKNFTVDEKIQFRIKLMQLMQGISLTSTAELPYRPYKFNNHYEPSLLAASTSTPCLKNPPSNASSPNSESSYNSS
ncbi:uncharacterized protein LOC143911198 [Arctopsyche grandis]|uniref:uncharacterized protein LOC143911198 n=1 Tax=Arctopsyche grandis TaxID=121162 RepID=UPI00406D72DD